MRWRFGRSSLATRSRRVATSTHTQEPPCLVYPSLATRVSSRLRWRQSPSHLVRFFKENGRKQFQGTGIIKALGEPFKNGGSGLCSTGSSAQSIRRIRARGFRLSVKNPLPNCSFSRKTPDLQQDKERWTPDIGQHRSVTQNVRTTEKLFPSVGKLCPSLRFRPYFPQPTATTLRTYLRLTLLTCVLAPFQCNLSL